jgi:hypothetical protein
MRGGDVYRIKPFDQGRYDFLLIFERHLTVPKAVADTCGIVEEEVHTIVIRGNYRVLRSSRRYYSSISFHISINVCVELQLKDARDEYVLDIVNGKPAVDLQREK